MVFWSPDSAWIGYTAGGRLYKVPAGGGESVLVADIKGVMTGGAAASWCPDGRILLSIGDGPIFRVSSLGGDLEPYIPVLEGKEGDLHDPECLPDNSVIFVPHATAARPHEMVLLVDGKRKSLLALPADQTIWFPSYSATGHILYRRDPANMGIWALPFSLARHEATGDPFLVAPSGDVPSVSHDGTLLHVRGQPAYETQMVVADRNGRIVTSIGEPVNQWPFPEFSPDGRRVALSARVNEVDDVWIYDVERDTRTRLSAGPVTYSTEAWSPDGRSLLYGEGNTIPIHLKLKSADGSGEAIDFGNGWSPDYSPDGRTIIYSTVQKGTDWDLFTRSADGKSPPVPFYVANDAQISPKISPDGRFVVFSSAEAGADDVYIKRFPSGEGKWEVSKGGGMWPRWGKSGKRLYYAHGNDLMEVDVTTTPDLKLGTPRLLFARPSIRRQLMFAWAPGFDVNDAEDRFVFCRAVGEEQNLTGMVVVQNWAAEFDASAAAAAAK
jgi:hypothetical protein